MGPKRQGSQRPQHSAEAKSTSSSVSSDGGFISPKLSKKRENFVLWHKSATLYLGGKFGRSATFMESGKAWVPDPIVYPTDAEVAVMSEIEKAITIDGIKEKNKARERIISKVKNEDEPQMFALLLASLDTDSYDLVTNDEIWKKLNESKDCAAFLLLIRTTHYALAKICVLDQARAMDNLNNLHQYPNEPIASYKLRHDDAVARCKALECADIPETMLACKFIRGLDPKRYGAMQVALENNSRSGIQDYPVTVAAAHKIASTWVVSASERGKPQVADDKIVFAAEKSAGKGKARKGRGDHSEETKAEEKAVSSDGSGFRGKCFNCGGFGHRSKECTKPKKEKSGAQAEEKEGHLTVSLEAYAAAAEIGDNFLGLDTMANV